MTFSLIHFLNLSFIVIGLLHSLEYLLNEKIFLSTFAEFGFGSGKFLFDCGVRCDINTEYTFLTSIKFINGSSLRINSSLSFSQDDYSFYVNYGSPNLISLKTGFDNNVHLLGFGFKFEK